MYPFFIGKKKKPLDGEMIPQKLQQDSRLLIQLLDCLAPVVIYT